MRIVPNNFPRFCFQKTRARGFTLIELLIVILIISIVTSFAVLSIHFNQNKQLESLSNQIVNTLQLAQEEALLRQTTLGLEITSSTYQFFEFHEAEETENAWRPVAASPLARHQLPDTIQLSLHLQNPTEEEHPKIIIAPNGDMTPFTLYIGKKHKPPRYKLVGEENGLIKNELIDEE